MEQCAELCQRQSAGGDFHGAPVEETPCSLLNLSRSLPGVVGGTPVPAVSIKPNDVDTPPLYPYQWKVKEHIDSVITGGRDRNLLIASPTGSGKTYAIKYAVETAEAAGGTCVLIAEPLIALCRQVYHQLRACTGAVIELKTGTSTMRSEGDGPPQAIVATYEVLARMAETSAGKFKNCSLLLIDEFHYISSERGATLLEILYASAQLPIVALSGTLPNRVDIARFLSSINHFPTDIAGADARPIPLTYYFYDCAKQRCRTFATTPDPRSPIDFRLIGGIYAKQDLLTLLSCLREWESCPVLCIAFSCERLNQYASWAAAVAPTPLRSVRTIIARSITAFLRSVPDDEHSLFTEAIMWLRQGIAVHHSHMATPYLELVCSLAEKRCLEFVFSSSTLSAGINLPVRTVCLLSARMPQSDSTGELRTLDIESLLFHQLAGRAGRPGYETHGFCVIVGRHAGAYRTASYLLSRPLEPVAPVLNYGLGDVLRTFRSGRRLSWEASMFKLNNTQERLARASHEISVRCLSLLSPAKQECVTTCAQALLECDRTPSHVFAMALPQAQTPWYVTFHERGEPTLEHGAGVIRLTTDRARSVYAIQDIGEILILRAKLRAMVQALDEYEEEWTAPSSDMRSSLAVVLNALRDNAQHAQEGEAEQALTKELRAQGTLAGDVLTVKGGASCMLRSFRNPGVTMSFFLQGSLTDPSRKIAAVSLCLGEWKNDATGLSGELEEDVERSLRGQMRCSAPGLCVASVQWAHGGSLAQVVEDTGVPCGVLCRHFVRVSEGLLEMAAAFDCLAIQHDLTECAKLMQRGIPFAHRMEYSDQGAI